MYTYIELHIYIYIYIYNTSDVQYVVYLIEMGKVMA